jgi:hypothetical protein
MLDLVKDETTALVLRMIGHHNRRREPIGSLRSTFTS